MASPSQDTAKTFSFDSEVVESDSHGGHVLGQPSRDESFVIDAGLQLGHAIWAVCFPDLPAEFQVRSL